MKKRSSLSAILLLFCVAAMAQDNSYLDSLKQRAMRAKTDVERIARLERVMLFYMAIDRNQSDEFSRQQLAIAERSRDRRLMVRVLLSDASRYYVVGSGNREDAGKALASSQKALELARTSGLEDGEAEAYLMLAHIARGNGESDKALNYNNLALSLSATIENDSLHIDCLNSLGDTYMLKKERLLAFRNYLQALTLAEELGSYEPLKSSYTRMSEFYQELNDYEKAKDYAFKVDVLTARHGEELDRLMAYRAIGQVYTASKQYDIATEYYEKILTLSDSIHFDLFKINGYLSILEQYLVSGQADKALAYINSKPYVALVMKQAHIEHYGYQIYGEVYKGMGRYDSAMYYYTLAEPLFETKANVANRYAFYINVAELYAAIDKPREALRYFQKARALGEALDNLEMKQGVSQALDTTYQKLGDFKSAYYYNRRYHDYTDSLKLLATEKDLMLLEVEDEHKRREREELKAEEARRDRHNIQYMGITAVIASVFIMLVMAGIFRVSQGTIKIIGFLAFIVLFEFIILIADNQIHHWTHGEPWKILLIKIGLISLLSPLHHFLEEKVIHYVISRRMLEGKETIWSRFRGKRTAEDEANAHS